MFLTSFDYYSDRYFTLYRIYEQDEGVYYVYSRNKRDYYGTFIEHEFWIKKVSGHWVSEPAVDKELLKEVGNEIEKAQRRNAGPRI